jgi:hypothetical protein
VDLAIDEQSGELIALSTVALTRFGADDERTVSLIDGRIWEDYPPLPTRFEHLADGTRVFAARNYERSTATLYGPTGAVLVQTELPPSQDELQAFSLRPLATHLAVVTDDKAWLGSWTDGFVELPTSLQLGPDPENGNTHRPGIAWLDDGIILWTQEGFEVFEDISDPESLFSWTFPEDDRSRIDEVQAVGDKIVVTTYDGARVFNKSGELIGGLDPLPCGQSRTSMVTAIAEDSVVVGASADYSYALKLGEMQ